MCTPAFLKLKDFPQHVHSAKRLDVWFSGRRDWREQLLCICVIFVMNKAWRITLSW